MRVLLDTNVLASVYATRSLSADVVRLVLAEHELIVGQIVHGELSRVLRKKIGLPESAVREALTTVEELRILDPRGFWEELR